MTVNMPDILRALVSLLILLLSLFLALSGVSVGFYVAALYAAGEFLYRTAKILNKISKKTGE